MNNKLNNLKHLVEVAANRLAVLKDKGFDGFPPGTYQWQTYQAALLEYSAFEKQYQALANRR